MTANTLDLLIANNATVIHVTAGVPWTRNLAIVSDWSKTYPLWYGPQFFQGINDVAEMMTNLQTAEKEELLDVFPFTVWSSMFSSAYYIVEHELFEVCKLLHLALDLDKSPGEMRHQGIVVH